MRFVISSSSETPAVLWRRSSIDSDSAARVRVVRRASATSVPIRVTKRE